MKKKRLVVLVWLAYGIAWALPVIKDGVTLPEGLPGWQALRVAASPVWSYEDFHASWPWYWKALSVLSAATNFVMVASLASAVRDARSWSRTIAWCSALAFLVNAQWCLRIEDFGDLRSGYFLWWGSFLALVVAFPSYSGIARGSLARTSEDVLGTP